MLLCYTVFFSSLGFEQLAQASIDYSELSTANWGTVNRDIHYYYDENGSCIEKIEAVKDVADPENGGQLTNPVSDYYYDKYGNLIGILNSLYDS